MERTFLVLILLCVLPITLGNQLDCCKKKRNGDIDYSLVDNNEKETNPYACKDGCIYETNNSRFCFKDGGELISKCISGSTLGCPDPESPSNGAWFCSGESCHLECDPGYAAIGKTTTVRSSAKCSWTVDPKKMTCSPAVALVIGGLRDNKGAEVYGPNIHYRLPNLPDTRTGASLDYVDSFIIACGGSMITFPLVPPFPLARDTCIQMDKDKTWSFHSKMHAGRDVHAHAVNLGKLTLLGGTDDPISRDTIEPAKSSDWTEEKIKKTKYSCAAKISATEFMVTGGEFGEFEALKYNSLTGEITPLANLMQKRSGHGCAFVKHGSMVGVIVAGGLPMGEQTWNADVTRQVTNHAEFYSLKSGKWEELGNLNEGRRGLGLVFVQDTLYAMGGFNGKKYVATVEKFDFATKTWSKVEDMLAPRAFAGITAVPVDMFKK